MSGAVAGAEPAALGAARAPVSLHRQFGELLRLAGPVVAARVGVMTMGVTDAVVVGRYSATQLGYQALGWSLTSVVLVTAMGLLTGVQVMASRALGEGEPARAGEALRRGLVYALWIGFGSMALLIFAGPALLRLSGVAPDLARGAVAPMTVLAISMPGFALSIAAGAWMEGISRPTPVTVFMWLANLVNLAVNLVLVPGKLGAPALGAAGAAWATFASRAGLTAAILIYIALMPDAKALGVFRRAPRDRPAEIEQRRIGYGAGASNFFEVAAFASMTLIAGSIGGTVVAAYTVVLNVASFVFMGPLGIATATAVLVARAYGAGDRRALERAALLGFAVTGAVGLAAALIVWPAARAIALAYTQDPATVALAAGGLALSALFLVPDALQVVIAQSLRARADVLAPSLTHLASYALVMIPLGWLLGARLGGGVDGIVAAIIASSFMSAGLLAARFRIVARRAALA